MPGQLCAAWRISETTCAAIANGPAISLSVAWRSPPRHAVLGESGSAEFRRLDKAALVVRKWQSSLVAFVRSTPRFVRGFLSAMDRNRAVELSKRVVALTEDIARIDGEAALACFRASPGVLRTVAIEQFEEWAQRGLSFAPTDNRARRIYFALETRGSNEALHSGAAVSPSTQSGICCVSMLRVSPDARWNWLPSPPFQWRQELVTGTRFTSPRW